MDCLFCKFAAGEIAVNKLYSSDLVFAIEDIAPQAPVHLLIMPVRHVENVSELAEVDSRALSELFAVAKAFAKERQLTGYRMVFNTGESAGQSVFHAHLHLLGGRPFAWPPG
jgi:diadenosine tetraphosphate (Ap4A) HIT family hydrolase